MKREDIFLTSNNTISVAVRAFTHDPQFVIIDEYL